MSERSSQIEEDSLGLESLVSDLRKYAGVAAALFVVVFAVIFVVTYVKTPTFDSTASLMISNENKQSVPGAAQRDEPTDAQMIDSEVEILKSNAVAERVVNQYHLEKDGEFNGEEHGFNPIGYVKGVISNLIKPPAAKVPSSSPLSAQIAHQSVLNAVLGHLSVQRVGSTKIIKVSFSSSSKEKAALLANAWTRAYLQTKLDTADAANSEVNGWLSQRLGDLRKEVEDSERAVQEYKIAHNLLSAGGSTVTEQEISDLNRQLATVQVDQAESTARLNTARQQLANGSNGDDVGESLNSSVISNLRSQAATTSARLAELQSHYGPLHPEVKKAKDQLADINSQIAAEIHRLMSNLEAQSKIQDQRTGSIASSVRRAQGQLVSNSKAMVKLNELVLNATSARQIYESYLDRYKQTVTQSGIQSGNASIVADAKVATGPSSPKLPLSLLLAFAGGAIAAAASIMLRRALDSGVTTSADVERRLHLPYLASILSLKSTLDKGQSTRLKPHQYIVEKSLSVFAEGFRNMRTSILFAVPDSQPKVIAVTSALPGEGKTTTSICLAAAVSMAGSSVIVVDCDLRKRSVNSLFGASVEYGLVEYLSGEATMSQVLQKDEKTGVSFIPISSAETTKQDIFASQAFDDLLARLRKDYDCVILDTAPVLPVVDTRILARKADFVAMLVRWRHTPIAAVQAAVHLLESAQIQVDGVVLTQVDLRKQSKFGYGDAGYYYRAYRGYYHAA